MKKFLVALSIAAIVFPSCKKDESSSGGVVSDSFSPGKAGSSWTYQSTSTGEYTLTMSNKDTTINGRVYNIYNSTTGANEYRAKDGNNYYRFFSIPTLLDAGLEELYLKSDVDEGGGWKVEQDINFGGVPPKVIFQYNIVTKGGTKTVLGKTYNNVTRVGLVVSVKNGPIASQTGNGTFYYSPDAGIISYKLLITQPLDPSTTLFDNSFELKSYTLK